MCALLSCATGTLATAWDLLSGAAGGVFRGDRWGAWDRVAGGGFGVRIDFSRPGKPTDNAFVESFNGTLRAECLDAHWFTTLAEAKQLIELWRREYNESRPHRALGEQTPNEFASQFAAQRELTGLQEPENSP